MSAMRLRPHHLLDIITAYGAGAKFEPHPYGHAVHTCAEIVLDNVETEIELVVGADFICDPCVHNIDGRCDDTVSHPGPPRAKQTYNDDLDRRVLAHLGLEEGQIMTARAFLLRAYERFAGLPEVCTHPGRSVGDRAGDLAAGLRRLGIG